MTDCEMCGKKDATFNVKVEETTMTVCSNCAKYGQAVQKPRSGFNSFSKSFSQNKNEEKVVANLGQQVKTLRREKGLNPEELANKVNERESIILKIESGSFRPSIKLANKLGKFFQKKFVSREDTSAKETKEQVSHKEQVFEKKEKHRSLTMGDLLSQAMKKK